MSSFTAIIALLYPLSTNNTNACFFLKFDRHNEVWYDAI